MKRLALNIILRSMSESNTKATQPDKDLADEERPVPSQAEGDLETVEEDLREKDGKPETPKHRG